MLLVQYGKLGFLASAECRFTAARGDRIVIRGSRGLELGTVLNADSRVPTAETCEAVRLATPADFAASDQNEALGLEVLAAADAAGLPVSFIDIEVSLDRTGAVLHVLPFAECDASSLLAELSDRFSLPIRLLDLARVPTSPDPPDPEKMTCGQPDCGTGSGCSSCSTGGCSTGSCSKGSVKSAADLTAFFSELREKMHTRTPLV